MHYYAHVLCYLDWVWLHKQLQKLPLFWVSESTLVLVEVDQMADELVVQNRSCSVLQLGSFLLL